MGISQPPLVPLAMYRRMSIFLRRNTEEFDIRLVIAGPPLDEALATRNLRPFLSLHKARKVNSLANKRSIIN